MLKMCTKCKTERDISFFYYDKRYSKYYSDCKHCRAEASKQYRSQRSSQIQQYQKDYYKNNKAAIDLKKSQYRIGNEVKIQKINKLYRENNKHKHSEYCNKRYHSDVNYSMCVKLRKRIYAAVKNKHGKTIDLIGCSIEELKIYLESKFQSGMTWDNWTLKGWHLDHIRPLSSFDLTDPVQLKQACHYTNLQPLWAKDNLSKGNKYTMELTDDT